jgi:hypothetical protein
MEEVEPGEPGASDDDIDVRQIDVRVLRTNLV